MSDERARAEDDGSPLEGRGWRARLRSGLTGLALLGVSISVAVVIGEGLVRTIRPQQLIALRRGDIWQAVDTLGYRHRANADAVINTGEGDVRFLTDHEGFRIGDKGRVESEASVVLMGDSFIEALQVEHEESVAGLLEESLSAEVGGTVAVRNTGVAGWNPNHYLIQARMLLERQCHDEFVVFFYTANDVIRRRQDRFSPRPSMEELIRPFRLPRSLSWSELIDAVLYPINDALEVRSHLFLLAKTRAAGLLMRLGLSKAYLPDVVRLDFEPDHAWGLTADVAADFARLADSTGASAHFVLIPAPYQVDPELLDMYLKGYGVSPDLVDIEQPSRRLGEAFENAGVELIDVLERFRAETKAGGSLYGEIDFHLSKEGHRVLEEEIRSAVLGSLNTPRDGACTPGAEQAGSSMGMLKN